MPAITEPIRLAPHLYTVYSEYPHRDSGNVFLITGRYPTLIDCGSQRATRQLVANLAQLDLRVTDLTQVIATHGDVDHIQGYTELQSRHPDLRLYIHREDWPIVQGSDPYRNASYLYRQPFVPFAPEHCLPLDDGQTIAAGDTTLTVHHTPGHTEGSICLQGTIDGHEVLFAGDTIGGAMRSLKGADLRIWAQAVATWERSLQQLTALPFDWVLNGHEPAETLPLARASVQRSVRSFGQMMNPWFSLDDESSALDSSAAAD